jgi:hypothetical protein
MVSVFPDAAGEDTGVGVTTAAAGAGGAAGTSLGEADAGVTETAAVVGA